MSCSQSFICNRLMWELIQHNYACSYFLNLTHMTILQVQSLKHTRLDTSVSPGGKFEISAWSLCKQVIKSLQTVILFIRIWALPPLNPPNLSCISLIIFLHLLSLPIELRLLHVENMHDHVSYPTQAVGFSEVYGIWWTCPRKLVLTVETGALN